MADLNPLSGLSNTSQRAQAALRALPQVSGATQRATKGDGYLNDIVKQSNDPLEKSLGQATRAAFLKMTTAAAQLAMHQAAFQALAKGVTGSVGAVYGAVALDAMSKSQQTADKSNIAGEYLATIGKDGANPQERLLGSESAKLINGFNTYSSRLVLAQATLRALSAGVTGPTGPVLASLALNALPGFGTEYAHQSTTAAHYLGLLSSHGTAEEKVVGQAASLAFNASSTYPGRVALTKKAMEAVVGGVSGPPGTILANLALKSVAVLGSTEYKDRSAVSDKFLGQIQKLGSPQEKLLAQTVSRISNAADTYTARLAISQVTFQAIAKGLAGNDAEMMAGQGLDCLKAISSTEYANRSNLAADFLKTLSSLGDDTQKALCRTGLAALNQADQYPSRVTIAQAVLSEVVGKAQSGLGQSLAAVGLKALAGISSTESKNRSTTANLFLDGIATSSPSYNEQVVARVVAAAGKGLDTYPTRNRTFETGLKAIQKGVEGSLVQHLAMLGAQAGSGMTNEVDKQAKVLESFVNAIGKYSDDSQLTQSAQSLLKQVHADNTWAGRIRLLNDFLNKTGKVAYQSKSAPDPAVPAADPVPPTPKASVSKPVESPKPVASASEPAKPDLKSQVNQEVLALWGSRLDQELAKTLSQGLVPDPAALASTTFPSVWPEIQSLLKPDQLEPWKEWALSSLPPLKFGEAFPPYSNAEPAYGGVEQSEREKRRLAVESVSSFERPASQPDLHLLRQALDALEPSMLAELSKRGYTFSVTRDRVSNADNRLDGRMQGERLADMHDGAHILENGQKPRIVVRSFWKDGRLQLDPSALLREIGRAYDLVIGAEGGKPSHVQAELADACVAEMKMLPARFHNQADFMAEAFARFHLDRDRCERELPLTAAALAQRAHGKHRINPQAMSQLQLSPPPVVNVHPDPLSELRDQEGLNRLRKLKGLPPVPYVFEIQSEPQHNAEALVSHLGETLRAARHAGVPRYSEDDGTVRVPAVTFNNPQALARLLDKQAQNGRGGFLVLDQLAQVPTNSPGFEVMNDYLERLGGQTPLLLQGSASDLQRLRGCLPTAVHKSFQTELLTAPMITELVSQTARLEGYEVSAEALAALGERAKDGELGQMFTFWRAIKSAQTERDTLLLPYLKTTPEAAKRVVISDVTNAKLALDRDPLQELQRLVGLGNAKRELKSVLAQVKLQKHQQEHGITADRPRLNLLFEGNPGTGKTTVAKLFADALKRVGYLKNNKFHEIRVQDLVSGKPEENVKKLFEENKGSVIFVDEMHQLKDTAEGRLAFRAMIPYLGHPDYAETVFIGAGYPGEMRDLIRDVDDGAERRFTSVPFEDYSRSELGSILDKMSVDKQRVLDESTREAALLRLERERRKMKNFGNAGSVSSLLDLAIKKQTSRLGEAEGPLTKEHFTQLISDDFALEKTLTPQEVWKEIDALEGLDLLKKELRTLCASIDYDREMGKDPLDSFEPYFILDGPPGTGKTTVARLIIKLMAAYDIIPDSGVSESQGADLQAGFVGQTTTKVQKLFESMWGQGGFIDEIGGLARAPEAFQADAAKTVLKQMEDHRGRFILVVADYADRVNEFLNIDPGIARRFGHRFSLEPLTVEGAVKSLSKQLLAKDLALTEETSALIATRMAQLEAAPGWASSGDVRKLLNTIITQQKTAFMEARAEGRPVSAKILLPGAVEAGFATLLREKAAKAAPKPSFADKVG